MKDLYLPMSAKFFSLFSVVSLGLLPYAKRTAAGTRPWPSSCSEALGPCPRALGPVRGSVSLLRAPWTRVESSSTLATWEAMDLCVFNTVYLIVDKR